MRLVSRRYRVDESFLQRTAVGAAHVCSLFWRLTLSRKLTNQGASLSCAHSGIGTGTSAPAPAPAGDGKQCMFRLTAAAAALLEFDEGQFDDVYGIIKLPVRWDADCHTRVVCETHGGGEIPLDCLHGLSPLEMAQKHDSRPFREGAR